MMIRSVSDLSTKTVITSQAAEEKSLRACSVRNVVDELVPAWSIEADGKEERPTQTACQKDRLTGFIHAEVKSQEPRL